MDSHLYGTDECIESWVHLETWFASNSNEMQIEIKLSKFDLSLTFKYLLDIHDC